jgi:hypothetical protein
LIVFYILDKANKNHCNFFAVEHTKERKANNFFKKAWKAIAFQALIILRV